MDWPDTSPADDGTTVVDLLRVLRRRRRTIIFVVAVLTAATTAFASQLEARYRAVASMVIEPYVSKIIDADEVRPASAIDRGALETHAEALQSRSIVLETMETMELFGDPEFGVESGPAAQLLEQLINLAHALLEHIPPDWHAWLGLSTAGAETAPQDEADTAAASANDSDDREVAALVFASSLDADYSADSYVMRVSFSSPDPERAAAVVNHIAELHVRKQLQAKRNVASRAISWLDKQLPIIQQDVLKAEQRIAEFRSQHPLLEAKSGSLAEAELYGVNRALVEARGALGGKRAKLEIIRLLQSTGGNLDTLADVIESPLISALRRQEAELAAKNAELATRLDTRHPARQAVHEEMAKLATQIEDQIGRIVSSLENDIAVAAAEVQRLGGEMRDAKVQNARDNEAGVQLLELDREAAAKRHLYEHLLRRYEEIVGQEGIVEPGVRIISEAEVPAAPHTPSPVVATTVGFTASVVIACLLALVLEQSDKTLRSARQVERHLGIPCLALVPTLPWSKRRSGLHRCLLDSPASAYAQSLRTLAVQAASRRRRPGVVLVTSALPEEGKSSLAAALAVCAAQTSGRKVVLVDFDLWRPTLAREFALPPTSGVSDFLIDGDWRAFDRDPDLELSHRARIDILPAGRRPAEGVQHLTVQSVSALLDELRERYDMIVIDVPPLLGVNDGRILAMLADDVILAVRWGRTSRVAAAGALKALRSTSTRICGAVLTRVDSKKHALYGEGDSLQYQRAFRKYYAG
jgi:uncharacterized protein involved in exopolysaccharide biosynthesis/Mrp family chromosome partitioning ATPase